MELPPTVSVALREGDGERGSPLMVAIGLFVAGGTSPVMTPCTKERR